MATTVELIVTSEDGQASHYRLHVASEALARTVVNQVRILLADNQIAREKRLAEVYKALIDLSDPYSDECDCYQNELASKVGLSVRHMRRMIVELEAMGLVVVQQTARGRKTKNTYLLPNLTTALELINNHAMSEAQSGEILSGFSLESRRLMSAMIPGVGMSGMNHDDDHDDDENHDMHDSSTRRTLSKGRSKIDLHLLFLHESERRNRLRQRHCTAAYLKAWDDWWAADQFQGFTNPAGWANLQIKKGF
jgi:DNA-binding MarR family transcriptional regulator